MRTYKNKLAICIMLLVAGLVEFGCGGGGSGANGVGGTTPVVGASGTDFWLTFPTTACTISATNCTENADQLLISSDQTTTGTVTFNGTVTPFSVSSGTPATIPLSSAVVLTTNEQIEPKGIHVAASSPVSVQTMSGDSSSMLDGTLAFPTQKLGTNYYVVSTSDTSVPISGSEFSIVATVNNTTVTITPTANGATHTAGTPFSIVLNAGDAYNYLNPGTADVSGTHITSTAPIAVYGAHPGVNIPNGVSYADNVVEQLPDVGKLGDVYAVRPFSGRTNYTVRIVATAPGTTLVYNPACSGCPTTLSTAGQYVEFAASAPYNVTSSAPVLVAQFMHGGMDAADGIGDPSLVMIAPMNQGVTDARFSVYGIPSSAGQYINVVTTTASLGNLKLDGVAVNPSLFTAIGTSNLSSGAIPVTAGTHRLQGSANFTGYVYDNGPVGVYVSYAYPLAYGLNSF